MTQNSRRRKRWRWKKKKKGKEKKEKKEKENKRMGRRRVHEIGREKWWNIEEEELEEKG